MIHPTAIIHSRATIGAGVSIGPYAVIGEDVAVGEGTWIGPHAVIEKWTDIGRENRIFQFASVGAVPQDLKFKGEKTILRLGDRNIVREFATLHRGTEGGGGETAIGSENLFMAYSHVAHDCVIGNQVILANGATLGGHVRIDDFAILGGLSAVHQFTRIGRNAMVSGGSMVAQDIPPFVIAQGDRARTVGINVIGLERRGFSAEVIQTLKKAYKLMFRTGLRTEEALQRIMLELPDGAELKTFVEFIRDSERGIAR